MDLKEVAEQLRQYKEENHPERTDDHSLVCEAVWAMHGDDANLVQCYDDDMVADGTTRLYWVIPENEGDETICVYDGKAVVDTIDGVTADINAAHCLKHDAQQCKHCGEFSHKTAVECPHCGRYVDGKECGELVLPETLAEMLQDGGSDEYRWVLKERLPTHETKATHTYVFIRLELMPTEGRYRGQYEKPEEWVCSICTVNVGMAGEKGAAAVQSCCGMTAEDWKALPHVGKAEALLEYGMAATLWQQTGVSPRRLLDACVKKLPEVNTFCGFMLDAPQNAIGTTGWERMAGDILAPIRRYRAAQKLR